MDFTGQQNHTICLVPDRMGDFHRYFSRLKESIEDDRKLLHETDIEVVFEPQVILIGDLLGETEEVAVKVIELASVINPFSVNLTVASYRDEDFYKSLFVDVEITGELTKAFSTACEIFQKPPESFEPHLSLAYGRMSPKFKRRVLETIGNSFFKYSFLADKLCLKIFFNGTAKSWIPIQEFPLDASS